MIAVLENAEQQCLDEYQNRQGKVLWGHTAGQWKYKAEGIRYAIDTIRALSESAL